MSLDRARQASFAGLLLAGTVLVADGTRFSQFAPLATSAGPAADESTPITFGNSVLQQWSIADRQSQLSMLKPNTGSWDMNTVNETGPHKGRYLFTVFETGQPGVQRHDLLTGETHTIWQSPAAATYTSFLAVDSALANPDNLAVDHEGNIYIIEDRNGGVDDDIWLAADLNEDGDLNDPREGIWRWATNGTPGSEFTGLYFDPTDKRRAWVNIQHPSSGNDRTIEITIPR